jgi:cell division protein FtsI (penicillin-binding protein 3)
LRTDELEPGDFESGNSDSPFLHRSITADAQSNPVKSPKRYRSMRNIKLMALTMTVLFLVGFGKLVSIQIVHAKEWTDKALSELTVTYNFAGVRGDILDRNGEVLATSVDKYLVYVDQNAASIFVPTDCNGYNQSYCHSINQQPIQMEGERAIAMMLETVLDIPYSELLPQIVGTSGYQVLAEGLSPERQRAVSALNINHVVGTILVPERAYPGENLASTLLGNVGTDGNGLGGLEYAYNAELTGTAGYLIYEQGVYGHEIPFGVSETIDAEPGATLVTTIDSKLQRKVQTAIDQGVKTNLADWGMAVVQEIKTGKILAMVDSDSPNANSLEVSLGGSRVVTQVFEPGSTEKMITAAALLEEGLQSPTSTFYVPDNLTIDGQNYVDSGTHEIQRYTLAGILANSSNVGILLAAQDLSFEKRWEWLKKFGYGEPTGLNLPGESVGLLSNYQNWDARTAQVVEFGQGVAVNAIQITNAYSTIGNLGVKQQPMLVDKIISADGTESILPQAEPERIFSESTASQLLLMMEGVVTEGLVTNFDTGKYRVGGKSGTAQLAGENGDYTQIMSSFIGIGPIDNPLYTVSIFFKDPKIAYFGALTAGPVFSDIMNFVLNQNNAPVSSYDTQPYPITW